MKQFIYSSKPFAAFAIQDEVLLDKKLSKIPKEIDILITHAPPYGILDLSLSKKHCGMKKLKEIVDKVKPKVHVFGHIHEANGIKKTEDTLFVNASVSRKNAGKKYFENVPICLSYDLNSKKFSLLK